MTLAEKIARYATAWSKSDSQAVGAEFTQDAKFVINRGDPHVGTEGISEMAASFMSEFPGMILRTDAWRGASDHAVHLWTLEGRHVETGNLVVLEGTEEWELDQNLRITHALGWYDAEDYQRQIDGG